jgi:hypothetical protein
MLAPCAQAADQKAIVGFAERGGLKAASPAAGVK